MSCTFNKIETTTSPLSYMISKGVHNIGSTVGNKYFFLSADKVVKGCYAISVSGELPEEVLDELRDRGVVYQSRDTSERSWKHFTSQSIHQITFVVY